MAMQTVNLALFIAGGTHDRAKFAAELLESFKACGFVRLIGHGISPVMVTRLFEMSAKFFNFPDEEKSRMANPPGPDPQRGWSKIGAENTSSLYRKGLLGEMGVEQSDAREHWDQGSKYDLDFPNRWPKEDLLPGFRETLESGFEQLESVCYQVMTALELAYQLPPGSFLSHISHEKNASEFRLNHYPEISLRALSNGKVGRIWPHYDLGIITLLFQDQVGGLEIEDRSRPGFFVPVECRSTSDLIVNVSETLTRWTNGQLPAGLHRVSPPPALKNIESGVVPKRFSIAYFCKANRDASAGPLKEFVVGDDAVYTEMTALEYHQQRLLSAY